MKTESAVYGQLKIGDLTAEIPVMQGGMGVGISLSSLAGAVAKEGGIGILSAAQIGYREPDFDTNPIEANLRAIGTEVAKAREIARGGIIGINIMVATREYDRYVRAALDAGVDLIVSGAGLPMTLPELAKGYDIKLVPIVSSEKSARVIFRYWMKKYNRLPDAVVVEGPRAGGHLGFSLSELTAYENKDADYDEEIGRILAFVKDFSAEKEIPVIIAGGIYDRKDMLHYLSMGASGVQMATRFVTTYECDAAQEYKNAYLRARKEDIVIVKSPVGMPGRAILNPFMKRAGQGQIPHGRCHLCIGKCNPQEMPYCITEALVNAAKGNVDQALLFCGSNAYRADHLETVKDIMEEFRI